MSDTPSFLLIPEVMERLQVSAAEVYGLLQRQELAFEREEGETRVKRSVLERYIEEQASQEKDYTEELERLVTLMEDRLHSRGVSVPEKGNEADLDRLMELVFYDALTLKVMSVHLDPMQEGGRLLYRLEGKVTELTRVSTRLLGVLQEFEKKQLTVDFGSGGSGGVYQRHVFGKKIQGLASCLPSTKGEHFYAQLLDDEAYPTLHELGYTEDQSLLLEEKLDGRPGLVIVASSPDALSERHRMAIARILSSGDRLVVSLERRLHFRTEDLIQLELGDDSDAVKHSWQMVLGMTPDAIMVDDLTDEESVRCMANAVSTGAQVVAFMSDSDVLTAFPRLQDRGVPTTVLTNILQLGIGRIPARELCPDCRQPRAVTEQEVVKFGVDPTAMVAEPSSCERCGDGFLAYKMIWQVVPLSDEMRGFLEEEADRNVITQYAAKDVNSAQRIGLQAALAQEIPLSDLDRLFR